MTGRGHAGERGGPAGDLYVVVRVARGRALPARRRGPRDRRRRGGAAGGAGHARSRCRRSTARCRSRCPRARSRARRSRMGGRGMPPLGRGRTGDLRVVVNVAIPRRLTREQRELLEELAELADRRQPARGRGHDREAQAGAGGVIRLGRAGDPRRQRTRSSLPGAAAILAARLRGRDLVGATRSSSSTASAVSAARRRSRRQVSRHAHARRAGLGDGLARASRAGRGRRDHDPPAVARRRAGRPRRRPGHHVRRWHRTRRRACAWSCCRAGRAAPLADWGAGAACSRVAAARSATRRSRRSSSTRQRSRRTARTASTRCRRLVARAARRRRRSVRRQPARGRCWRR